MRDEEKSKDELINELLEARSRIAELEESSTDLKRSREDLEEVKEQFAAHFETVPIPTYTWEWNGSDFLLVGYNESAEEITREQIIGLQGARAAELYHDNRAILDDLSKCLNEKSSSRKEMLYKLKTTGEEKYLSVTYAFVPPNFVMVHTEDITDKKLTEAALREVNQRLEARIEERTAQLSEMVEHLNTEISCRLETERALEREKLKFQMLSDHSPFGIALISATGSFDYINPKFSEMFGYDLSHCPDGRHWFRLAYPDPEYRRRVISAWLEDMAGALPGEVRPREFTVTCRNGEKKLIHFRPVQLETGADLMTCEDVTEQRKMEQALRESEHRFRDLYDNLRDGVAAVDKRGKIVRCNRQFLSMLGYTFDEVLELNYQDITPRRWHAMESRILKEQVDTRGYSDLYEKEYIHKNGTLFPIEIQTYLVQDGNGRDFGYWAVVRDITDRKKAEEQIKKSLREKEVLLREVHHRVKNNLAVVNSLLRLQSRDAKDDFHRQMFLDAQDRIRSMALVHERLCQSEDLAGVNVARYVSSLVNHLVNTQRGIGSSVLFEKHVESVQLELEKAVPLGFLINELVSNALKHAYSNRAQKTLYISFRLLDEKVYELIVRDEGIGFPEYVDVENPQSLGLTLVKLFTKQINGEIEVLRDAGTEFRIRFSDRPS